MKKALFFAIMLVILTLCGCATTSGDDSSQPDISSSTITSTFTNKFGSATTKCAHSGCNNYIASSGDTNCCVDHSNKCGECGCYIDGDALFCVSCLTEAAEKVAETPKSSTTKSTFTNKFGSATTKCAHSGCNNYIASSGDTNCCVAHSNKCGECGCYIDGDALFCISCLEKALS